MGLSLHLLHSANSWGCAILGVRPGDRQYFGLRWPVASPAGNIWHPTRSVSPVSSRVYSPVNPATEDSRFARRMYRNSSLDKKMEWALVLFFHIIVAAGISILATGVSDLQSGTGTSTDSVLVKVGISILTVSWFILVVWAGISLMPAQKIRSAPAYSEGRMVGLLNATNSSLEGAVAKTCLASSYCKPSSSVSSFSESASSSAWSPWSRSPITSTPSPARSPSA
jgi:hypothetical protein